MGTLHPYKEGVCMPIAATPVNAPTKRALTGMLSNSEVWQFMGRNTKR